MLVSVLSPVYDGFSRPNSINYTWQIVLFISSKEVTTVFPYLIIVTVEKSCMKFSDGWYSNPSIITS